MEPFRVTCETCRSRLKVRSAEAIGEIHACPKCSSMVLIVPPPGWVPDASPVAPVPISKPSPTAAPEPALTPASSVSTVLPTEFAFDDVAAQVQPAPAINGLPPVEQSAPPEAPLVSEAARGLSPAAWCFVGAAAVFAAAGLTYALWPNNDTQPIAQAAPVTAATKPVEPAAGSENPNANTPIPAIAADERAAVNDAGAADDTTPVDKTAQSESPPSNTTPDLSSTAQPAAPVASQPADAPAPKPAPQTAPTTAAVTPALPTSGSVATRETSPVRPEAASPGSAEGPNHVLKFDPLDFDLEHLSLSSTSAKPRIDMPTASTSSIPPAATAEAEPVAALPPPAKPPAPGDLLPPPIDVNQPIKSRRGPVADEPTRNVDVAQRLGTRVKSLRLAEMPLAKFIDTISSMAGVPITLDPILLELNGISPRTPATADATDAPFDKVLTDALAANRFELVEQDGFATVSIPQSAESKSVDFDVKDLIESGDAETILKLIERFVAPDSWQVAGGKGSIKVDGAVLHIEQSLLVRREALIFCERLRLARGQQPRSKYPREMLTVESPYEKLAPVLTKSTTFTFMPWTRLADVVSQLEEMTGLTILVDWAALGKVEFGPSSPVSCSAIDRPWSESLDGVLAPLGLAWWAVDAQTLQITTSTALERIERVEFYPIAPKLRDEYPKDEALIAALQSAIEKRPGHQPDDSGGRMTVDTPSSRLIVRASPAVHRYLHQRLHSPAEPLAKHE